ncbi:hypothetical protein JOB18_046831 [Solea senegalensis]|uniref:Uncharacterized protein n=1 Tax=Solea senegalensis TaxID=28829 RepID=A0AAV6SJA9_SOLSE|nr:hypothetical protein JOB18_046831 [Solea senegalensis]
MSSQYANEPEGPLSAGAWHGRWDTVNLTWTRTLRRQTHENKITFKQQQHAAA